jgi:hypothetical protein
VDTELTVWGWIGFAPGERRQVRLVCAAKTQAAVARAAGKRYPRQLFNLAKTGNAEELTTARAQPGVVFWSPLDSYHGPWSSL